MASRKNIRDIIGNTEISDDDKVGRIMDLIHSETDTLRDQLDTSASELKKAQEDLTTANATITSKDEELSKAKQDFDAYKAAEQDAKDKNVKANAYKSLLKNAGVNENRIDTIMKVTDLTSVSMNKDGSIKDANGMTEKIKEEWADFISVKETVNTPVANPPANNNANSETMTKAQIMAITDRAERRKAIMEHPEAFR